MGETNSPLVAHMSYDIFPRATEGESIYNVRKVLRY
jgi:hypothetical protein